MADPILDDMEDVTPWKKRVDRALPILIGTSLFIAIGALLYYSSMTARDQNRALMDQQRSYEIVTLSRRLDSTIAKAESTLARYVISMDRDIGLQYQDKWQSASKELEALKRVTRNDPVQRQLVDKLSAAYRERGNTLNDIALRINYNQKETALGKFYQASKAQSLARINSLLEQVIETENERLRESNVVVEKAGDEVQQVTKTYRLVGLALIIGLLVLGWFVRMIMQERRRERREIDDEYFRAQALEAAVSARTEELQLAYAKLQQESSERARAEESLRQMQKMEAVGQLTGGIAHDFNNMLTVVVGGLELARKRVEDVHDAVRHIDNAMEGANRASELTRRLLAFARSEPMLRETRSPDELVQGMADLIDRAIGDQVKVNLDLHCDDWKIHVDSHQFENVVINLAVNARDAMEGRGTLTIRTGHNRLRAGEIGDCAAGEYILLSVVDDGCGMSEHVLEHVFEPFFTTKDIGKGTGLGLSQVFGFVRQCAGEIRITSQPGQGAKVDIYLPRHQSAPVGMQPANIAQPAKPVASADNDDALGVKILVVEDDPRVLAQTRSALADLGHDCISCDHPHKAIAMLQENRDIELILSDVLMPDMTGPEMIASLPPLYQSIPVVFVTGYAGDVSGNEMFEGHSLLRKPYTLMALKQAITQAVSQQRALSSSVVQA